jgi:hypothetical protein
MKFSSALIKKGELWLGCKELQSAGASACLNEITRYYNGKDTNEAWCAKFVWMVVDLCARDFRMKNLLVKTASTGVMVSTKSIPVDSTPAPGCVFYKTRPGGGHVGFVKEITTGNKLITLEGNMKNKVGWGSHANYEGYKFIHTEKMPLLNGKPDDGQILMRLPSPMYEIYAGMSTEELVLAGITAAAAAGTGIYIAKMKKLF